MRIVSLPIILHPGDVIMLSYIPICFQFAGTFIVSADASVS